MIPKAALALKPWRAVLGALALVAAALSAPPAAADVFIWKDPQTGQTRMSNIAPPWLREPVPGRRVPKVDVVRGNKVMDPATAFANPQRPLEPAPVQKAPPAAAAGQPAVSQPAGARPAAPAVPEDES